MSPADDAPTFSEDDPLARPRARRAFLKKAAWGTALGAMGFYGVLDVAMNAEARAQTRADGRPRLPDGQRVLRRLRPMGGRPGSPSLEDFRLRVHGEVERELSLSFAELRALPQVTQTSDVHCVTGWSVLGAEFVGVRVSELARRAGVRTSARHVIFEAAHGYTANVPMRMAMRDDVLVTHRLDGSPLSRTHGGPARALVPDLYFWKSAKWITGVRFSRRDAPGYWEVRGYHNYGDPWREQRYG